MRANKVKEIWAAGGIVRNAWLALDSTMSAEGMAHVGWDSCTVDLQHGFCDEDMARKLFQVVSTTDAAPMARIAWNDPAKIMRVLDDGCYGIVCPMVNTPEQAADLVKWSKYPPLGERSAGPQRGLLYGGADYIAAANDILVNLAMVETREAIGNLDAICRTEGIDGVYVGPSDLALSLGHPAKPVPDAQEVLDAIAEIGRGARAAGKVAGIHCGSVEMANRWIAEGFQLVTIYTDYVAMLTKARENLAAIKVR